MIRDLTSALVIAGLLWALASNREQSSETDSPPFPEPSPAVEPTVPAPPPSQADVVPAGDIETDCSDVKCVLFTASWCAPCVPTKAAAKAACEQTGATYVEVDFDRFGDYSRRWSVSQLPTIILTRGGVERWRHEGGRNESQLVSAIEAAGGGGWSQSELRDAVNEHARRRPREKRAQVRGMTVKQHLTRDHGWPAELVDGLTEDQQHWLHDASHEGTILP